MSARPAASPGAPALRGDARASRGVVSAFALLLAGVPALALLLADSPALADDAPDEVPLALANGMAPSPWKDFKLTLDGYLRVRADVFDDLDLSRGTTPTTGQPIFPVPASGGARHTLEAADMRVRLQPTLEIGQSVRLHLRVDVLDDVGFGTTPDVLPSDSAFAGAAQGASSPTAGVNALKDAIRIKHAWGEVVLPFGLLAAGRMGALVSWGTGFFVNNGDCLSCDGGDSGDRIALTVPLFGHFITALYEVSASGPYSSSLGQDIPLDPLGQVNTVALSVARWRSPEAQLRRLRAGRPLVEYGLLASYRWQSVDAPAWTQPGGLARTYGPNDYVKRGLESVAGDLWLLVHRGGLRAELEAATVLGKIDDASNTPGVSLRNPVLSRQFGGVASVSYSFGVPVRLRFEAGFASADDAPGFGVRFPPGQLTTQKGDLTGPHLRPPVEYTVDNFRFSPDYHVDLILWRRIVGTVSDGFYLRPTVRLGPFGSAFHHLTLDVSAVISGTFYAQTAPGQDSYLGTELDVMARYRYEAGFEIDLAYGLLLPGAGFRNVAQGIDPQPAQTVELILAYRL